MPYLKMTGKDFKVSLKHDFTDLLNGTSGAIEDIQAVKKDMRFTRDEKRVYKEKVEKAEKNIRKIKRLLNI